MKRSWGRWLAAGLTASAALSWSLWRWSGLSPSALAHFPVPVLAEERAAPEAAVSPVEASLDAWRLAAVGARVTALASGENVLWIGTFDGGLYRLWLLGSGEGGAPLGPVGQRDAKFEVKHQGGFGQIALAVEQADQLGGTLQ